MKGLGVIICHRGSFQFSLNQKVCSAKAGESLFIPEEGAFQVLQESEDMEVQILIYQIEPIRDIMGNAVVTMYIRGLLLMSLVVCGPPVKKKKSRNICLCSTVLWR